MPGGNREYDLFGTRRAEAVQQIFLALAGQNPKFLGVENPGDIIRMESGRVDDIACAEAPSVRRCDFPEVVRLFGGCYLELLEQADAIEACRLHKRKDHAVGFNDSATRRVKAAEDCRIQLGLQFAHPGSIAQLNAGDAVRHPLLVKLLHRIQLLFREGGHQNAAALEGKSQFGVQTVKGQIALEFQAPFQCIGRRIVEAAVHNARIRLGDTGAYVHLLFQKHGAHLEMRQAVGHGGADDAASYNCNIKQVFHQKSPFVY